MTKMTILYSSSEIHAGIKHLFGQPNARERRVALVAYVGGDGESYLPHPEGLHLICSPSPGGTDPDTLRRLLKRGARVEFANGLHMKVYWSRSRGCIITSANASSNALGVSSLKEAGVFLPPGVVKIDQLIKYAHAKPIQPSDLRRLDRLAGEHTKNMGRRDSSKKQPLDFLDWYSSRHRSEWKIVASDELVTGNPKATKEQTLSEYGRKDPNKWVAVKRGRIRPNDWLLSYATTDAGAKFAEWLYADFVVKGDLKERRFYDRNYPYYVVQVNSPTRYPLPPFKITPAFRSALNKALEQYLPKRDMDAKSNVVSVRFLDLIARGMKAK